MNKRFYWPVLVPVVFTVLWNCGCGKKGQQRFEVSGEVTFRGQPLDQGVIEFHPMDGQGSKDGATIENGSYRIPKSKGLFAGKYKLFMFAGDGISGGPSDGSPDVVRRKPVPGLVLGKERIPEEFNTKSKAVVEVTESGPNKFDFHFK